MIGLALYLIVGIAVFFFCRELAKQYPYFKDDMRFGWFIMTIYPVTLLIVFIEWGFGKHQIFAKGERNEKEETAELLRRCERQD